MVVSADDELVERVLRGVAARPVAAVVAQRDGVGERHVDADAPSHGDGGLSHLDGVGEPSALVIRRVDDDLRLSRQTPEGRRVDDPVPVALEAGPERIQLLLAGPFARARRERRPRHEHQLLEGLALLTATRVAGRRAGVRRLVGGDEVVAMAVHCGGPELGSWQRGIHLPLRYRPQRSARGTHSSRCGPT